MITRRDILPLFLAGLAMPAIAHAGESVPHDVFGHTLDGLDGNAIALQRFRGKVLLVVNTASKCAFTPQYEGLERLWRTLGPRGLVVVGIPSNDFGGQEPGSAKEIRGFCSKNYDVTFPMAARMPVTGADAHPLYRDFEVALGRDAGVPGWNFHKILVGRDGAPVAGFSSDIRPLDPRIVLAIEAELGKKAASG